LLGESDGVVWLLVWARASVAPNARSALAAVALRTSLMIISTVGLCAE
jgi:hypothetical protein